MSDTTSNNTSIVYSRLTIAVVQAIALYLLYLTAQNEWWPATDRMIFIPLVVLFLAAPVVAIAGIQNFRLKPLLIWTLVVAFLAITLSAYHAWREPNTSLKAADISIPMFAMVIIVFIGHALWRAAENDQKLIANYHTYFDVAWFQGVQVVLTAIFVCLFWAVLYLGAGLFKLVKIDLFSDIIQEAWFWIPASTLAVATSLHITDTDNSLVRGVRQLSLNLMSWLLPLMTVIVGAFVFVLLFTGLEPLWRTRMATGLLTSTSIFLILLINTAYQDGDEKHRLNRIIEHAKLPAALLLVPLVAIASYATYLRIAQYGLTPSRIIGIVVLLVLAGHAIGYASSLRSLDNRISNLRMTNVILAFAVPAIVVLLFTPIADPYRLSVNNQLARLKSGKISAEKFDYAFLRRRSGRYGQEALDALAAKNKSWHTDAMAEKAAEEKKRKDRYITTKATPQNRAENISVAFPVGAELPKDFIEFDWANEERQWWLPPCLRYQRECKAVLANLNTDPENEILLIENYRAIIFAKDQNAKWSYAGTMSFGACKSLKKKMLAGKFTTIQPRTNDIEIDGARLQLTQQSSPNCPDKK